jgi:hypothetical protein
VRWAGSSGDFLPTAPLSEKATARQDETRHLADRVLANFHSWLRGEYSAEALIGKKVGVFPDVRLKEGRWYGQNFDPGGIDPISKEKLLRITGGDPDTVGRKWIGPWHGVHPMKVFLI